MLHGTRTKTNSGKAKPGHCNLVGSLFTIQKLSFDSFYNFRHAICEMEVAVWITWSSYVKVLSASLCIQLVMSGTWLARRPFVKGTFRKKQPSAIAGCKGQIFGYGQVTGTKLCSPSPCHCLGCYTCSVSSCPYPAANRALFPQKMWKKYFQCWIKVYCEMTPNVFWALLQCPGGEAQQELAWLV